MLARVVVGNDQIVQPIAGDIASEDKIAGFVELIVTVNDDVVVAARREIQRRSGGKRLPQHDINASRVGRIAVGQVDTENDIPIGVAIEVPDGSGVRVAATKRQRGAHVAECRWADKTQVPRGGVVEIAGGGGKEIRTAVDDIGHAGTGASSVVRGRCADQQVGNAVGIHIAGGNGGAEIVVDLRTEDGLIDTARCKIDHAAAVGARSATHDVNLARPAAPRFGRRDDDIVVAVSVQIARPQRASPIPPGDRTLVDGSSIVACVQHRCGGRDACQRHGDECDD